ncbi:MAG: sulfotransferase [Xanthomonadales bacterium]|nr:sulfotransferase [Xanthomonadales bacterium]
MQNVPVVPPHDAEAGGARLRRNLQRAETYAAAGQIDAAIQSLEAVLQVQPDLATAYLQLAELHLRQGRFGAAERRTHAALAANIDSPRTAMMLLRMLSKLSLSGLMREVVAQLTPPMWDSATSLAAVAQELSLCGANDLAKQFADAAVARDPAHPQALFMAATADVFFGDLQRAGELAERCLMRIPDDPGSHWLLSRMRRPNADQRVARIHAALDRVDNDEDESWLAYALHNELHDLRDFDAAGDALQRACRAKRSTLDYSTQAADRVFDALEAWTEPSPTAAGYATEHLTPVFVIGLHRSGTTLAERIISGHSAMAAGGETYDVRAQIRRAADHYFPGEVSLEAIARRDELDYTAIGRGYLEGMRWRAEGKRWVTDKLPSNYFNVGFIARALPTARFIHLNRDPIDVGLSSLRTLFSQACPYSYDQDEFVHHYRRYARLMAHWRNQFGDRILDVRYQDLVDDPQAQAARMAEFVGLAFEPGMVDIKRRKDAVSTASSVMMRDGIRKDRGEVWRSYEAILQPLITAFR